MKAVPARERVCITVDMLHSLGGIVYLPTYGSHTQFSPVTDNDLA